MGLLVNQSSAARELAAAVQHVRSGGSVPQEWLDRVEAIAAAPSKTFTVALGTGLLAKATEPQIDPLALKATSGPRAYSARGLAHQVLVPAAVELGLDLRATGREPLNNQPFFRYDRIDEMDRVHVGARVHHALLVDALREVDSLTQNEARAALAAFVAARLRPDRESVTIGRSRLATQALILATNEFVLENAEGGKRAQALVAASFDLVFDAVLMGRINDPSRLMPGDVQAIVEETVSLAAEARHKVVTTTDALQFAARLDRANVRRGLVAIVDPHQPPLPRAEIADAAERKHGVTLFMTEGVAELMRSALMWSARPVDLTAEFPERMLYRLEEIEADPKSILRWAKLF